MKFVIIGRNIEVTPGLKSAVEDKLGKLEKYFNEDTEIHVALSVEKDTILAKNDEIVVFGDYGLIKELFMGD